MAKRTTPGKLSKETRIRLYATRRTLPLSVQSDVGLRFNVNVYFKDPLVAKNNPGADIDKDFEVPWEPGITHGPTSARFAVVDYDSSSGTLEEPAQWDETTNAFLGPKGVDLNTARGRSLAQFRQVSVWATVQHTLDFFEGGRGLGRRIEWGFEGNRLLLVPTAGYGENAYYDRMSKSLQFYWFVADAGRVNTCESSDIVNHEFGHAVLDGLRPYYFESILTETGAFHEFMGDLTALLMAFRNNVFRKKIVEQSKGDLADASLLASLAQQFGEAVTAQPYLRTALNQMKMSDAATANSHTMSQVLTGAVFDVMISLLNIRKARELDRQAANPAYKLASLERLFWYTIDHMQMCAIQPLDFLPPCDVTFRDYALAVLRAEKITNPIDPDGFRKAIFEAFLHREILTEGDRSVLDPTPVFTRPGLAVFHSIDDISASRGSAYRFLDDNRRELLIPPTVDLKVADIARARKLTTEGRQQSDQIVLQYIWKEEISLNGAQFGKFDGERTAMLCGGTIVLDQNGNLIHWSRKPGTEVLGTDDARKNERADGLARRSKFLEDLAKRIKLGMIGDTQFSPLGVLARAIPPYEAGRQDGLLTFGMSPHFNLNHDDDQEVGGRQWQISS
ncbi:serine protease [Agrobacterium larrymoorei]|uniref:serine protease n=1 Tax=Agrobacterium larrymoorei TaxID=160699 RepID=UPI0015725BB6|nr:serine protease [Agrobacterium larrymoorei]NTJ45284.1 serine protease [Agrobacterium larrymoorei]